MRQVYCCLSNGRDEPAVDWPRGHTDDVWFIDGPGELEMELPGGRHGKFDFTLIEVRREGARVRTIRVFGAAGPLDGAYAQATTLVRDWGVSGQASLDRWRDLRRRDGMGYRDPAGPNWSSDSGRNDPFPRYGVTVQTTHRSDTPWCAVWGVVFATPGDTAAP